MILILGASSYIGRHICDQWENTGFIATHNTRPASGSVYFDATQMSLSDILPGHSDVTHALILYALTRIDDCKADPHRSYEINVRSTKAVIDLLIEHGIKPIFTSSEHAFNGEKGGYTEEDPAHPMTMYGSQKVEIESYLEQHCADYVVLRLAKVFGTDPTDRTILSRWIGQIRDGEEIRCARDQIFSPIHIDNVVAATDAVIRLNLSGIYHIANPEPWSRLALLRGLLSTIGLDARVAECSIRDFDFVDPRPLDLSMDPRKIMAATGLQFKTMLSCYEELSARLLAGDGVGGPAS